MKCDICGKRIFKTQQVVRLSVESAAMGVGDAESPLLWSNVKEYRPVFVAHWHCARHTHRYREEVMGLASMSGASSLKLINGGSNG